jgi:hypothetical protein
MVDRTERFYLKRTINNLELLKVVKEAWNFLFMMHSFTHKLKEICVFDFPTRLANALAYTLQRENWADATLGD